MHFVFKLYVIGFKLNVFDIECFFCAGPVFIPITSLKTKQNKTISITFELTR